MHKTIEEINLGLSTLAVTFSKDGSDSFKIVDKFVDLTQERLKSIHINL